MSSALKLYKNVLLKYPVVIQSIQTGMLMATGDIVAQTIVEKKSVRNVSLTRTAQFFTIGTCAVGPALTAWYSFLAKRIGDGGKSVALKKVVLDQVLFAPVCVGFFLTALTLIQGKGIQHTKEELNDKYLDVLLANYEIWPFVQLVNFSLVPLHYQVLVVQVVAIMWNAYLSWKTHLEIKRGSLEK